jgi:hypothetical protein
MAGRCPCASVEKTKYVLLTCQRNAGQNHSAKIVNTSFENVANLKYFETTVTNRNLINREIKAH